MAGRCEQIVRDGGSAFDDYALPQAALMLRQGFGRLLRSHDDRGVVAVLDGRLHTARYAGRCWPRSAGPRVRRSPRSRSSSRVRSSSRRDLNDSGCTMRVGEQAQARSHAANQERKAAVGTPHASRVQAGQSREAVSAGVACWARRRRARRGGGRRRALRDQRVRERQAGRHEDAGQERDLRRDRFQEEHGPQHTTDPKTKVVYTQSDPPTSGKHYQSPPPLMIYDVPVPQWILLHALEHGNVLVQYGNKVSAADRPRCARRCSVTATARSMAPYPKLGKRVVYTAWQRMLSCQGFQKDALTGAQAKWAGMNGVAPSARRSTRPARACSPAPAGSTARLRLAPLRTRRARAAAVRASRRAADT